MDNSNKKIGFSEEVCAALNEAIPVHHRVGPMNKSYSYHRGSDIIRQMNKVFGHDWSSEAIKDFEVHDQIVVLVSVRVSGPLGVVVHQGYGSSQIARKKGTNEIIDIGNAYKTAYTNGLKKACEQFGVGLGLSEEDDTAPAKAPAAGTYTAAKKPNYTVSQAAPAVKQQVSFPSGGPTKQPFVNRQAMPAPSRPSAPAPTTDGMITDMQRSAINSIVKTKKLDAAELIKNSLGGSTKSTVESLTKAEAVKVIRFATSTTPKG